jgi:hypothetical protein
MRYWAFVSRCRRAFNFRMEMKSAVLMSASYSGRSLSLSVPWFARSARASIRFCTGGSIWKSTTRQILRQGSGLVVPTACPGHLQRSCDYGSTEDDPPGRQWHHALLFSAQPYAGKKVSSRTTFSGLQETFCDTGKEFSDLRQKSDAGSSSNLPADVEPVSSAHCLFVNVPMDRAPRIRDSQMGMTSGVTP